MKYFLKILMVTLVFSVSSDFAHACMFKQQISEAIEKHDAIFTGKVVGCFDEGEESFVKLSLDKIWKGEIQKFYKASASCKDTFFKNGKDYLVYAKYLEDSEHINISYEFCDSYQTVMILSSWRQAFNSFIISIRSTWYNFRNLGILTSPYINFEVSDFRELGAPMYEFK